MEFNGGANETDFGVKKSTKTGREDCDLDSHGSMSHTVTSHSYRRLPVLMVERFRGDRFFNSRYFRRQAAEIRLRNPAIPGAILHQLIS